MWGFSKNEFSTPAVQLRANDVDLVLSTVALPTTYLLLLDGQFAIFLDSLHNAFSNTSLQPAGNNHVIAILNYLLEMLLKLSGHIGSWVLHVS